MGTSTSSQTPRPRPLGSILAKGCQKKYSRYLINCLPIIEPLTGKSFLAATFRLTVINPLAGQRSANPLLGDSFAGQNTSKTCYKWKNNYLCVKKEVLVILKHISHIQCHHDSVTLKRTFICSKPQYFPHSRITRKTHKNHN